jgi:hypothetical protein
VGTILNDDGPVLRITDASKAEGNSGTTPFTFTVTLSPASAGPVTVKYATANGTALAGSDYAAVPATLLTFAPGQTSKTVTVNVMGNTTVEPNETFAVNLSAASGATIFDGQGVGTILNDDGVVTNLVANGGFENPGTGITIPSGGHHTYASGDTFPGWQVTSGSVDIQTSAHGGVHSGLYALDLAGSAAGSISQTLSTVAGQQYTLELWYAAHPYHPYSGPAQAQVRWGGSNVGLLSRDPTTTTTNSMTRVQYVVTASSSTTTLSLAGLSPNGGIIVDDVSVIAR